VEVLKGTALAALVFAIPSLDQQTKSDILQDAGKQLFDASSGVIAVQARLGFDEAIVERASAESEAQSTYLRISQNQLVNADPFETATKLQAIQLQLETHFAVTARLSELSLLRYI
jgi:flagellar hook-associated protein 3 FlgL